MIDKFSETVFNEYGLLVALLTGAVYILYRRNIEMTDKIMQISNDSVKILTELKALIKGKNND